MLGYRGIRDLRNESQCAFRADHQMLNDVDRVGKVNERVQAVARCVLHLEFVADALGEDGVCFDGCGER